MQVSVKNVHVKVLGAVFKQHFLEKLFYLTTHKHSKDVYIFLGL